MRLAPIAFIGLALTALTAGCDNSCQQICDRMANYAEDCGIDVSREDVQACKDAQAGSASRDDRAVCRENNGRSDIRDEWDCEEVGAYFNVTTSAPEGE